MSIEPIQPIEGSARKNSTSSSTTAPVLHDPSLNKMSDKEKVDELKKSDSGAALDNGANALSYDGKTREQMTDLERAQFDRESRYLTGSKLLPPFLTLLSFFS